VYTIYFTEAAWKQLESGIAVYSDFLTDPSPATKSEFFLRRRKWQKVSVDDRPKSAVSALDHCGQFLNTKLLLQLLATLPITTAEAERMFSKMKKTATAIRAEMEGIKFTNLLEKSIFDHSVCQIIGPAAAGSAGPVPTPERPRGQFFYRGPGPPEPSPAGAGAGRRP